MINYNSTIYDKQRLWIEEARSNGKEWDSILFGGGSSEQDLQVFLSQQSALNFWNISLNEWKELVCIEKEGEDNKLSISYSERSAVISNDYDSENSVQVPRTPNSCWQKYRKHLIEDSQFLMEDVSEIEKSSLRILQKLNIKTKGNAVKGLVVGNVQSGKTANMAALMSMAADHGFNMFIVLSGTIENLRQQTLNRLLSDLNRPGCNITWEGIDRPRKNCSITDKTQSKHFDNISHTRYLIVSLKNSSRLKNLIQWLHDDEKSANQMKILIIDDESDQAGINTKSVDDEERTKINDLLVNLVGNRNEKGQGCNDCFEAMNYIGYTATPYANVLNEAKQESLYPKDFIATLQTSRSYFGPQQIFGDRNSNNYPGLDIIRTISENEIKDIKRIHDGDRSTYPCELEKSLAWFICCVAVMRFKNSKKPVSMLIHTSQLTKHHYQIQKLIQTWFRRKDDYILTLCRSVWETETKEFTKDDLSRDYPMFAYSIESMQYYPAFSEIEEIILQILKSGLTSIKLGEDEEFKYSRGIHLCVDNCQNKGVRGDGVFMRLAYPDKKTSPGYATAFIVIGGATLSRGLTIEGLVSTYFLRSTKQADTLMQMGRWFGYRKGYELLQRIWLSRNTVRQFEFLADMDSELRENIYRMELFKKKPRDYAVIIKQSSSLNLIRISSSNRIQSAIETEMDYSGMHSQTHLFVQDNQVIHNNFTAADEFLRSLGKPETGNGSVGKSTFIWRGIPYDLVFDRLLNVYKFDEGNRVFSEENLSLIREWIGSATEAKSLLDWNVVLFGKNSGNKGCIGGCCINKVVRTRKNKLRDETSNTIDIKILTDPTEKIADVIYDKLSADLKIKYNDYHTDYAPEIRQGSGLSRVPSIIIYMIDEKSGENTNDPDKGTLGIKEPLIGLSINIPGDKVNNKYACSIMIDLKKFGLGADLEEAEESEN